MQEENRLSQNTLEMLVADVDGLLLKYGIKDVKRARLIDRFVFTFESEPDI